MPSVTDVESHLTVAADAVTLANWQTEPYLDWAFQHLDEVIPTAPIAAAAYPLVLPRNPTDLTGLPVTLPEGEHSTVGAVMAATDTDGWAVLHRGALVAEAYPRGMAPQTRHLLMSVSKSLVGMTAGVLVERGSLDPERAVEAYVPQVAHSGYAGASVRDLLDMRSGIGFSEEYLDPNADVRIMEQAIDWAPRTSPDVPATLYGFLASLKQVRPHGGPFEYRSCETNMLGWVCEAATGAHLTTLLSELLWQPMGAETDGFIGTDSVGTGLADGGICVTVRDLVRFGSLLLQDGASATGVQVVPAAWVHDTWAGGPDSTAAFAASPTVTLMPGGMYRNQVWHPYASRDVLVCLGIHGQMVYVNRVTGVVAAKVSSWALPQNGWKLFATLAAFDAIGASLTA